MKTGKNPKDWGDFVCPNDGKKSKIINKILRFIIENTMPKGPLNK